MASKAKSIGKFLTSLATGFSISSGTTSKTLTVNNSISLSGTDNSTLNIGGGGTLGSAAYTASNAYQTPIGIINGLVKGNGVNSLTAADANIDYVTPTGVVTLTK
jgi:hypothetical protein